MKCPECGKHHDNLNSEAAHACESRAMGDMEQGIVASIPERSKTMKAAFRRADRWHEYTFFFV